VQIPRLSDQQDRHVTALLSAGTPEATAPLVMYSEFDPDSIDTLPINALEVLRSEASAAIVARDAIDDCFSPEWLAAHQEAVAACKRASAELERLAKNPKTRYGNWRTPCDVELMTLGYI